MQPRMQRWLAVATLAGFGLIDLRAVHAPAAGTPAADELVASARARLDSHHDAAGAIMELDRAVELDPSLPFAYKTRSRLRRASGDYRGAPADADQAILLKSHGIHR